MGTSRTQIVRLSLTLCLVGLMVLCIVCVKNIQTSSSQVWQENIRKQALYEKAPNCFLHHDPATIDQSLAPCQNVTATLIDKTQQSYGNPLRYYRQPLYHLFFTLRFSNGEKRTVGSIYKGMWQSVRIGDQVAVLLWDGQAENVAANGYRCSLIDMTGSDHGMTRLLPWIAVIFLCAFLLGRLWNYGANLVVSAALV